MSNKTLVYLSKKNGDLVDLYEPGIIDINKLYSEFQNDYEHYVMISQLHQCFDTQQIKFETVDHLFVEASKSNLSYDKIDLLQNYINDIIGQLNVFLNELKKIVGEVNFQLITKYLYDNNLNYRILCEMRNIVQHKNKIHFYYFCNNLIFDFEELLKDYKLTTAKFDRTFKNLKKICAVDLWTIVKQTEELLVQYLYAKICDIKNLKRFYNCLLKYNTKDKNLAIRIIQGQDILYYYIMFDKIQLLIFLYDTIPLNVKNEIMLINKLE